VFFVDGHGRLAQAVPDQRGQGQQEWQVSELPGSPARSTALAATSYLLGRPSTAAGPARLGAAVYYLTRSGRPAVTYAASGQPWRSMALPGTATKILGADAYQAAGQPSRVFLSGQPGSGQPGSGQPSSGQPSSGQPSSGQLSLDEARGPGGPWAAQSLTPSSPRLPLAMLLLAAGFMAVLGLAAFLLVRRRLAQARGPGKGVLG
jgi:hypothetical protein